MKRSCQDHLNDKAKHRSTTKKNSQNTYYPSFYFHTKTGKNCLKNICIFYRVPKALFMWGVLVIITTNFGREKRSV